MSVYSACTSELVHLSFTIKTFLHFTLWFKWPKKWNQRKKSFKLSDRIFWSFRIVTSLKLQNKVKDVKLWKIFITQCIRWTFESNCFKPTFFYALLHIAYILKIFLAIYSLCFGLHNTILLSFLFNYSICTAVCLPTQYK